MNEELIELKRKYDMQVSKEAIEEIKHTIDLDREIERLHSIIKEAREYIEKRKEDNKSCSVCSVITDDILEILDKVEEK